jgi:hypothetical protein
MSGMVRRNALLPFLILDQNAFRDHTVFDPALERARSTGCKLMVIDAALIEMTKNIPHWEETTRRSFALLAQRPDLVTIGRAVPELLLLEHETGAPAFDQLEAEDLVPQFRAFLAETQTGSGSTIENARREIAQAQALMHKQYLDGPRNKRRIQRWCETYKQMFSGAEDRERLREPEVRRSFLADQRWAEMLQTELEKAGCLVASRLAYERSVSAHTLLASALVGLRWFVNGGVETARESTATNDLMDADYATLGSFCRELITKENKLREEWEDLQAIGELRVFSRDAG